MADINLYTTETVGSEILPAALPLVVSGEVAEPNKVRSALLRFSKVIHGGVDSDNFSASALSEAIPWRAVRKGALCDAWTVGGTANMDFLAYQFDSAQDDFSTVDDLHEDARWLPVPGACQTVVLKNPAVCLVTWNISGLADGVDGSFAAWGLQINGVTQDALVRWFRGAGAHYEDASGYAKQRIYSGHMVVHLDAGTTDVALCVTGTSEHMKVFRQWVRSMQVIPMYYGTSSGYADVAGPDVG